MTDLEKAQMRIACVIEANKLKQSSSSTIINELKGESVVDVAKDLAAFVLSA